MAGAVEVAEPNGGGAGGASEDGPQGGGGVAEGSGGEVGCRSAMDCSNDDPMDGVEVCVEGECGPGNAPPRIVSITPGDGEPGAEPNAEIVIQLSEALDAASVTAERVRLLDGGIAVPARVAYQGDTITLTPSSPLRRRGSYEVKVSDELADVEGAGLLMPFESRFTVRDGSWHAVDAVRGSLSELAAALPLLPDGRVLLVWAGNDGGNCPVSAAWVPLGASAVTKTPFEPGTSSCGQLAVAAGGASAAVGWTADRAWFVQQERGQKWLAAGTMVTDAPQPRILALGMSPSGVLTRFDYADSGGVVRSRSTDAKGSWAAESETLSHGHYISQPAVAYDAAGNGLAVWAITDDETSRARIVASRFAADTGKWGTAVDLPGSVAEDGEDRLVRGAPSVAMAPSGEALVAWRAGAEGKSTLMATYFAPNTGWELAELASGTTQLPFISEAPGLAFDGERFVTAWVGTADGKTSQMFTASYAPKTGWSAPVGHDAKKKLPFSEFPRLASDSHGGLLLVWRVGTAPSYTLVHRRFIDGQWGSIEAVPGSTITDARTYGVRMPALSMNEAGVAALSWASYADERISTIRLATFH